MSATANVYEEIERLRRQLHQGLGSGYDPARIQALAPISRELDRLTVELARQQLDSSRTELKR